MLKRIRGIKKDDWLLARRSLLAANLVVVVLIVWGFAGEYLRHRQLQGEIERLTAEAEQLEHAISPRFEDRISALLGEPAFDPHGDPIPDRQLQLNESAEVISLARLPTGATGLIRQVASQDEHLLVYFAALGLQPGRSVTIMVRNPLDGTMRVTIEGTQGEQVFGDQIAQAIFVTVEKH